MSDFSNYGILLEMFGFVVLLLVSGRNPNAAHPVLNQHKEVLFDKLTLFPNSFFRLNVTKIIIMDQKNNSYFKNFLDCDRIKQKIIVRKQSR